MTGPGERDGGGRREREADWVRRMTLHLLQGQPEEVQQVRDEIRAAAQAELDQDAVDRTAHEANRRAHQLLLHVLHDQQEEASRLLEGIPEGLQLVALTHGVLGTAPGVEPSATGSPRERALQSAQAAVAAHRAKGVPDHVLAEMYRSAAERSYRLSEGERLRPY